MISPEIKLISSNEGQLAEALRITPGFQRFVRAIVTTTEIVLLTDESAASDVTRPLPFALNDPVQISNFLRAWLVYSIPPERSSAHTEKGWVLVASQKRITLTVAWMKNDRALPRTSSRGHGG